MPRRPTSPSTLYETSLACIVNSKEFLSDARVLARKGSSGHAFALLVLAEEELGKAYLMILASIGLQVPNSILKRDHVAKQVVCSTVFQELNLMLFAHLGRVFSIWSEYGDSDQTTRRTGILQARFAKRWELAVAKEGKDGSSAHSELLRVRSLENRKWAGLYVDMDDRRISSPQDFSRSETAHALRRVERIHRRLSNAFDMTRRLTDREIGKYLGRLGPDLSLVRHNLQAMVDSLETVAKSLRAHKE
jgi:AbiV family abortive infection protein